MYFNKQPLEIQKHIIQYIKIISTEKYEIINEDGKQIDTFCYKENKMCKLINKLFNKLIN